MEMDAGRRSRKGNWIVKVVSEWCRRNRHQHLSDQQETLRLKLQGHYNCYGVTGNFRAVQRFFYEVRKVWRKWLNRRTRANPMPWRKFLMLEKHYPLP